MPALLFKGSMKPSEHGGEVVTDEAAPLLNLRGDNTETFADIGAWLGLDGNNVYDNIFYAAGPNDVAAWPSLHVAYPFLAFLVLRRGFGRIAWVVGAYAAVVAFSVVYTGDHWVHDCIAVIGCQKMTELTTPEILAQAWAKGGIIFNQHIILVK